MSDPQARIRVRDFEDDAPSGPAVFLVRRSYRRRRLQDAARVLPILGLAFWLVPLFWHGGDAPRASRALLYIFGVWGALVLASAWLGWRLGRPDTADSGEAEREDSAP